MTAPFLARSFFTKGWAEATTGFEPVIRVLQTLAFPLGHVAGNKMADRKWLAVFQPSAISHLPLFRAGNETRTRDLLLGKEAFYQLNYARMFGLHVRPRMPRPRIELGTPRFSVACSTN
jgi:hypothetical protein